MRQLIQTKIPRVYSVSGGPDPGAVLAELNGKVIRDEGVLKARRKEHEAHSRDLQEVEAELLEVEDDLKTLGAVDPEELQRAQDRHAELTATKAKLESELTGVWESALPLALLGGYRKELHNALLAEERRREWETAKSTVEPKIPQVKQDVFGDVPGDFALQPDVEAFYMQRLENALHSLFHPPPDGMPDRVYVADRNDTSVQIRSRLAASQSQLSDLTKMCVDIERMDVELREINQKVKLIHQNAAAFKRGTELHQKRGGLHERREQLTKRLKEIDAEVSRMEVELTDLKRQESIQREVAEKAERGESLAALATRYREAAGEIRTRAANQMRRQISESVGELWVRITERQREFEGIDFDNHWQCWMVRRDGGKVTWEETNTSSGQRQVRMLAFYEALRRLAKLAPPLVVDTPLGRLDKEVKDSVLDQLYLTGHQTIILTTNSEIDPDGPLFERIEDKLARVYTLQPCGREGSVNYEVEVTNEYFGRKI